MSSRNTCAACGSRGKRQCPAACPFFPFGTSAYDTWLQVDGSWQNKALNFVSRHLGLVELKALTDEFMLEGGGPQLELENAVDGAIYGALFLRRDPDGRTLADQWQKDGWRGLNNDEQVMMQHRRHTLPTVIEVQRVLDDQALECVDLFASPSNDIHRLRPQFRPSGRAVYTGVHLADALPAFQPDRLRRNRTS